MDSIQTTVSGEAFGVVCMLCSILFVALVIALRKLHEQRLQQKELKQSVQSLTRQLVKTEYQQKQYEESVRQQMLDYQKGMVSARPLDVHYGAFNNGGRE